MKIIFSAQILGKTLMITDNNLSLVVRKKLATLASGIDVGQGINVGPGKFGKKNKRRALNRQ